MKKLLLLLLFFVSVNAYAFEFEYKLVFFDIPQSEISGAAIANMPDDTIILNGKNREWFMMFSDKQFEKDCAYLAAAGRVKFIDCDKRFRIEMLDSLAVGDKRIPAVQIFFSVPEDGKIFRKEFKNYVLYTSAAPEKEVAFLVRKRDGKTIQIFGKFGEKHLKWLRLKPLDSNK